MPGAPFPPHLFEGRFKQMGKEGLEGGEEVGVGLADEARTRRAVRWKGAGERGERVSDIPLFPLTVVLMRGAPLPLHIFEERYKQMVNECLEEESEFGMVLADESGTRRVGCTARIVELVERYEDGRMLILVEGSRRFRLNSILTGKPYYVGEVEYLEEEQEEEDVNALAEECITLLERVVEAATEGSVGIEIKPPYRNLSFAIAGRIELDRKSTRLNSSH